MISEIFQISSGANQFWTGEFIQFAREAYAKQDANTVARFIEQVTKFLNVPQHIVVGVLDGSMKWERDYVTVIVTRETPREDISFVASICSSRIKAEQAAQRWIDLGLATDETVSIEFDGSSHLVRIGTQK